MAIDNDKKRLKNNEQPDKQNNLQSLLVKKARQFNFMQATQLLENSHTQANPVGYLHSPQDEAVRFRAVPSLGFSASDIDSCIINGPQQAELRVNFMGLYGPSSSLPAYFTEAVIAEEVENSGEDGRHYYLNTPTQLKEFQRHRIYIKKLEFEAEKIRYKVQSGEYSAFKLDEVQISLLKAGSELEQVIGKEGAEAFKVGSAVLEIIETAPARQRDFLDIFNHRLVSLYYRACKKYQPFRDHLQGGNDEFSQQLYALIGAPSEPQRQQSHLDWPKLLPFSGLLAMKQANKERIVKVICGYFGLNYVEVKEGVLRQVTIPTDQLAIIQGQSLVLGDNFMIGREVADRCGKFTVVIQQLDLDTFKHFLPPAIYGDVAAGQHYFAIKELLNFIKPASLIYGIELELKPQAVPSFTISKDSSCRLGWSTWLGSKAQEQSQSVVIE